MKYRMTFFAAVIGAGLAAEGADWPEWGGSGTKNMVAKGSLPLDFAPGEGKTVEEIQQSGKNLRWVAKLGSQSYGTPTVAGGKVFVGTNNEDPRNDQIKGDRGVLMCFDEKTGKFLWQFTSPKLGAGKVSDWEFLGICSSALIDAKAGAGYVVTNRGEVIAFDVDGMADGNDGEFKDEGKYMAGGLDGMDKATAVEVGSEDADILWGFDMRTELGVFPHNITSSSVATDGERIFVTTSNGVDWSHLNIPAPMAPCLIALDKETGKLAGEEGSGIGERTLHCNWSSPGYVEHKGKPMVLFGAGDGFVYALKPEPVKNAEGFDILPEIFRYDANKKSYRFNESGEPIKYATFPGPSELISTPVYHNGRIYAAIGQDPEHGEGVGLLSCIPADLEGKFENQQGALWSYDGIKRTISTASVTDDGLLFIADYSGVVHCLEADTGKVIWTHDTLSHIWGSTLVAGGFVYLGNEDGEVILIKASRDADTDGDGKIKGGELVTAVEFPSPVYSSPVAANGTLLIATQTHLYAFGKAE